MFDGVDLIRHIDWLDSSIASAKLVLMLKTAPTADLMILYHSFSTSFMLWGLIHTTPA